MLVCGLVVGMAQADEKSAADAHTASLERCFALQRNEPRRAIEIAERVLADVPLPVQTEIKAQSCLGMAAAYIGDTARAIAAADRMERLIDAHPQPGDIALRTFSNAGAILHQVDQIPRALILYERAERVALEEESEVAQFKTLINIALLHAEHLGDPDGAEILFQRAQAIAERIDEPDVLLYYNRAQNLLRLGQQDDARRMFERARAETDRVDNTLFRLRIRSELAALARPGDPVAQTRELNEVITAQHALPDPGGEASSLVLLSRVQLQHGDATAAEASASLAERLTQVDSLLHERMDAIRARIAALRALHRMEDALLQTERLAALQLSAMRRINLEGLAELQARLQDAAAARELDRLRLERRIQDLSLERTRLARNWAIASLIAIGLAVIAFGLFQRRVNRRLKRLSTLDALTGLFNRRAATQRLGLPAVDAADETNARALILLVDIDHFKQVNDRYGHAVGDLILTELSARLKAGCRPGDIVARWGGEEFLLACGSMTLDQAQVVAERLRAAVADVPFPLPDGQRIPATISIGFAPYPFFPHTDAPSEHPWQDAIRLADRALYAAKHSGRNAWVGLWGLRPDGDIEAVLYDPARAEADGMIAVVSRGPVAWTPPAPPPELAAF